MMSVAYTLASFLSWFPPFFRAIIIGAFALLALYVVIKLVIAVLDAIPFL